MDQNNVIEPTMPKKLFVILFFAMTLLAGYCLWDLIQSQQEDDLHDRSQLSVEDIRKRQYQDNLHTRHQMLRLLWTEQYSALDGELDKQFAEYKSGKIPASDFAAQLWTLRMADTAYDERFITWIKRRPSSTWATLTYGLFSLQLAWNARGSDVVSHTQKNRLEAMRLFAQRAHLFLHETADKGLSPALYGGGLIGTNMLLGKDEGHRALVDRALSEDPKLWLAARAYFQTLYPQWGGSEQTMRAFIEEIRPRAPQLATRLDAEFVWRKGLDFETSGQPDLAIEKYEKAIQIYPDGDALKNLGELYVRAGKCEQATAVLELNLAKNDQWDLWTLEMLHQAQRCAHRPDNARTTRAKIDELLLRFKEGV